MINKDIYVECTVCGRRLHNHYGSTPCCGALAFVVKEDKETVKAIRDANEAG